MTTKASTAVGTKEFVKSYEPTPFERRTLDAFHAEEKEKPPAPRIKVSEKNGVTQLAFDHTESAITRAVILEALGTHDFDFMNGLVGQLANVASKAARSTNASLISCSRWSRA